MAIFKVDGVEVPQILEAEVKTRLAAPNANAPTSIPTTEFHLVVRLDHSILISEWSRSPQDKRYRRCELTITDTEGKPLHIWTIPKAFIREYSEAEFRPELVSEAKAHSHLTGYDMRFVVVAQMPLTTDFKAQEDVQLRSASV